MSASVFGPFVKPAGLTLKILMQFHNKKQSKFCRGWLTNSSSHKMINFGKLNLGQGYMKLGLSSIT